MVVFFYGVSGGRAREGAKRSKRAKIQKLNFNGDSWSAEMLTSSHIVLPDIKIYGPVEPIKDMAQLNLKDMT